jgi:hypothetical protein
MTWTRIKCWLGFHEYARITKYVDDQAVDEWVKCAWCGRRRPR